MEKLYLGVGRQIITPKVGCQLYGYRPTLFSDAVEDDLTATAFCFQQGETRAMMITVTVCLISTPLCDELREIAAKETGIPKDCCMISATHTHSGPNTCGNEGWGGLDREYCDQILKPGIAAAAKAAASHTQPVKMGVGTGKSLVGINRREFKNGNDIALGQNPWGCFNPEMTVITFRNEAGNTVANIIHYGCHGTAAGLNTQITRDWSGVMTDTLEMNTGAITAFFNGPEGDVGPRLSNGLTIGRPEGNVRYVYELGHAAARDAVNIHKSIHACHDAALNVGSGIARIPLKKRLSPEESARLYEEHKDHSVNMLGKIRAHALALIASHQRGDADQEFFDMQQTVIRIGEIVFASTMFETFSEIGMRIDTMREDKKVLCLSNTNGSEGYFVTQDQICRGGYEVTMFQYAHLQSYCDDADWHLIQETLANIDAVVPR